MPFYLEMSKNITQQRDPITNNIYIYILFLQSNTKGSFLHICVSSVENDSDFLTLKVL